MRKSFPGPIVEFAFYIPTPTDMRIVGKDLANIINLVQREFVIRVD